MLEVNLRPCLSRSTRLACAEHWAGHIDVSILLEDWSLATVLQNRTVLGQGVYATLKPRRAPRSDSWFVTTDILIRLNINSYRRMTMWSLFFKESAVYIPGESSRRAEPADILCCDPGLRSPGCGALLFCWVRQSFVTVALAKRGFRFLLIWGVLQWAVNIEYLLSSK